MRQLVFNKKFANYSVLKAVIGIVLFAGFLANSGAVTAPALKDEKPSIPPDLFYDFKPVPPEDNAIINWRRAAGVKTPLPGNLSEVIRYASRLSAPRPSDDDLNLLRSWLRRNKEALDLFDASLHRPKAQWPEQNPQNRQPELSAFGPLINARLFEADLLAEEKQFTNAVESLEGSLKLTQFGIDGEPGSAQYIVSTIVRTSTQQAMVRLAANRQMPEPLLNRLLKDLPRLDSETNAFIRMLAVAFSRGAKLNVDVHMLAEKWAKISETNDALLIFPTELQRPFKVLVDPLLVSMHPKPLDEFIQIKKDILHARIFRTNCISAWSNRNDAVQVERDETIKRLKEDIEPLMKLVEDEPLPLSKQAADRARNAYLQIKNPIGRISAGEVSVVADGDARVFRCRTEREAMRAIVGLLLFERQKGILPGKLSDLVDAKILDSVPIDFFANAPLSYSRERRIVWSAGQDGENNGGEGEDRLNWYSGDAVWQVPKIN